MAWRLCPWPRCLLKFCGIRDASSKRGTKASWPLASKLAGLEKASCGASSTVLPPEYRELPVFFVEILVALLEYEALFGGLRNFSSYPRIDHKVKREEFSQSYTDFEYIYLTIAGFAQLHVHCEDIVRKNNGQPFTKNPGVQMLESVAGMTMHGERPGANALLRTGGPCLIEAFALAKTRKNGMVEFFKGAFDRKADPCLEGRTARILEYLESKGGKDLGSATTPPWEDVSLRPLPPSATPQDIVGEHLRVFVSECTWRWSRSKSLDYEIAKAKRLDDEHAEEFSMLYNAETFEAAAIARGVAPGPSMQWETIDDIGDWRAYGESSNELVERARVQGEERVVLKMGPRQWTYELDLRRKVQRNRKTGTERPIRCLETFVLRPGMITQDELRAAIAYYIELMTLPPSPFGPPPNGS